MWKCLMCGKNNTDQTKICTCGFEHSKDYTCFLTLTGLTNSEKTVWCEEQPGSESVREWVKFAEMVKNELRHLDDIEASWFLAQMKKNCDSILHSAKNLIEEAWKITEEGHRWYLGNGCDQDYVRAVECYQKASDMGNEEATNSLGVCYLKGLGVAMDYKRAVELFHQAAQAEDAHAQFNLGLCYQNGLGLKKNMDNSFVWYMQAAENGFPKAQRKVGDHYYTLGYQNKDLHLAKKYMEDAAKWYEKAAYAGDLESQRHLAYCYRNGIGVKINKEKAAGWYEKAALQGDVMSQKIMAELCENGEGIKLDRAKAEMWRQRAAGR